MSNEGEMMFGGNSKEVLKQTIEKIEHIEAQKADLSEDVKEVYAEAKGCGFDTKIMRQVIRRRKIEREDRDEMDDMIKVYEETIESIEELLS